MPSINQPAAGHAGPVVPGGHAYQPLTNAGFVRLVQDAFAIITPRITGHAPCNAAFRALPNGRTFAALWVDPAIWINFDPRNVSGDFGATSGNDITITAFSLGMGKWTVAATLVHEMAHVNGAPGNTHAAEGTLRSCLLADHENPAIIGTRLDPVLRIRTATA